MNYGYCALRSEYPTQGVCLVCGRYSKNPEDCIYLKNIKTMPMTLLTETLETGYSVSCKEFPTVNEKGAPKEEALKNFFSKMAEIFSARISKNKQEN